MDYDRKRREMEKERLELLRRLEKIETELNEQRIENERKLSAIYMMWRFYTTTLYRVELSNGTRYVEHFFTERERAEEYMRHMKMVGYVPATLPEILEIPTINLDDEHVDKVISILN